MKHLSTSGNKLMRSNLLSTVCGTQIRLLANYFRDFCVMSYQTICAFALPSALRLFVWLFCPVSKSNSSKNISILCNTQYFSIWVLLRRKTGLSILSANLQSVSWWVSLLENETTANISHDGAQYFISSAGKWCQISRLEALSCLPFVLLLSYSRQYDIAGNTVNKLGVLQLWEGVTILRQICQPSFVQKLSER